MEMNRKILEIGKQYRCRGVGVVELLATHNELCWLSYPEYEITLIRNVSSLSEAEARYHHLKNVMKNTALKISKDGIATGNFHFAWVSGDNDEYLYCFKDGKTSYTGDSLVMFTEHDVEIIED